MVWYKKRGEWKLEKREIIFFSFSLFPRTRGTGRLKSIQWRNTLDYVFLPPNSWWVQQEKFGRGKKKKKKDIICFFFFFFPFGRLFLFYFDKHATIRNKDQSPRIDQASSKSFCRRHKQSGQSHYLACYQWASYKIANNILVPDVPF